MIHVSPHVCQVSVSLGDGLSIVCEHGPAAAMHAMSTKGFFCTDCNSHRTIAVVLITACLRGQRNTGAVFHITRIKSRAWIKPISPSVMPVRALFHLREVFYLASCFYVLLKLTPAHRHTDTQSQTHTHTTHTGSRSQ